MDEQRDFVNRSRVSEEYKSECEFTQHLFVLLTYTLGCIQVGRISARSNRIHNLRRIAP